MDTQKLAKMMKNEVNTAPLLPDGQTRLVSLDKVFLENSDLSLSEKDHLGVVARLLMNSFILKPYVYGTNSKGVTDEKTATGFSFNVIHSITIERVFATYQCPSCKECSFVAIDFRDSYVDHNNKRFNGFIKMECQSCKYNQTDVIYVENNLDNYLAHRVQVCR